MTLKIVTLQFTVHCNIILFDWITNKQYLIWFEFIWITKTKFYEPRWPAVTLACNRQTIGLWQSVLLHLWIDWKQDKNLKDNVEIRITFFTIADYVTIRVGTIILVADLHRGSTISWSVEPWNRPRESNARTTASLASNRFIPCKVESDIWWTSMAKAPTTKQNSKKEYQVKDFKAYSKICRRIDDVTFVVDDAD